MFKKYTPNFHLAYLITTLPFYAHTTEQSAYTKNHTNTYYAYNATLTLQS